VTPALVACKCQSFRVEPGTLCAWCQLDKNGKRLGWERIDRETCPRVLVGKGCRNYESEDSFGSCWCGTRLNDHGNHWRDSNGNEFIVWEPYGIDGDRLAIVLSAADAEGLDVWIGHWGLWHGTTTAIRFKARTQ
jgi:hypothetical protein